jgi:hypothetical protein
VLHTSELQLGRVFLESLVVSNEMGDVEYQESTPTAARRERWLRGVGTAGRGGASCAGLGFCSSTMLGIMGWLLLLLLLVVETEL